MPKMIDVMVRHRVVAQDCPFCGSSSVSVVTVFVEKGRHPVMMCEECHCYGPRTVYVQTETDAVNAWNGRNGCGE